MRSIQLFVMLSFCIHLNAADSLKVSKTIPEVKARIFMDTLMDIRGTELDTFGFIPDFIFIVRDHNGTILPSRYYTPWLQRVGTNSYYGYGFGFDTSHGIKLDSAYHSSHSYAVVFRYGHLHAKHDTVFFQTILNIDAAQGKTHVYDFMMGMDEYTSECIIRTQGHFRKKDKVLIEGVYEKQGVYAVLESEDLGHTNFYQEFIEQLDLPERRKKKIWCFCNTIPIAFKRQ